jgi:hypothetical protein
MHKNHGTGFVLVDDVLHLEGHDLLLVFPSFPLASKLKFCLGDRVVDFEGNLRKLQVCLARLDNVEDAQASWSLCLGGDVRVGLLTVLAVLLVVGVELEHLLLARVDLIRDVVFALLVVGHSLFVWLLAEELIEARIAKFNLVFLLLVHHDDIFGQVENQVAHLSFLALTDFFLHEQVRLLANSHIKRRLEYEPT